MKMKSTFGKLLRMSWIRSMTNSVAHYNSGLDTSHMLNAILKSVSEFIGQAEQSDDVSILVVRRRLEDA